MRARLRTSGFTLIEILVGMAIGLIGSVIIFQVFAVNEEYKRSTTSGAEGQSAGALGLYAIEREIKFAGFGMPDREALGCNTLAYTSTRATTNYGFRMVPVMIHPGANAATPDAIGVNYGDPAEFSPGYGLVAANMAPGANFRLENRGGIRQFDFLLAYQRSAANCVLMNASNLPGPAALACGGNNSTDAVETCSTAKVDADGVSRTYNPGGGIAGAPTFTVQTTVNNTRLYNLGPNPSFNVFRVIDGTLKLCNLRLADCGNTAAANWLDVMESVVFLKAQYGMDTDDDGAVDTWDTRICRDATGFAGYTEVKQVGAAVVGKFDNVGSVWATPTDANADGLMDGFAVAGGTPTGYDWSRILAIRIAIIVRGQQFEKTDVAPATIKLWPDATSASGCLGGALGTPSVGPVYSVPVNDRRYRHRVFETIVPIRNSMWIQG